MSLVMAVETGPVIGNRLSTEAAAQGIRNINDQKVLNATIERINKTKTAFDSVNEQGKRIAGSIKETAGKTADEAAKNADQLKNILNKTIETLHGSIAKTQQTNIALYKAASTGGGAAAGAGAGAAETGKGAKINVQG
ncbi:MAG: hypothetical protein HZA01_04470 [Nitrospinae bacterium]|nr:hypothetical protein [Nitrospinota bacterium]